MVSLALKLPSDSMDQVLLHIEELKELISYILPDPSIVSFVIEGSHTLAVGFNLTSFLRTTDLIEKHSEIIKLMQQELKVDQNL